MMTVPLKSVRDAVASLAGIQASKQLSPAMGEQIILFISEQRRDLWTRYPWPELTEIEERQFRAAWDETVTYAEDDEVWDEDSQTYYRSLIDDNLFHAVTDADRWEQTTDLDCYVLRNQENETLIGNVYEVWSADPRTDSGAERLEYELRGDRIQFTDTVPVTVWVEFQLMPVDLDATIWSEGETVLGGTVRYVVQVGECYRALVPTNGEFPPLSGEWELVPMPLCLAPIVKLFASADYLDADGQQDRAIRRRGQGNTLLEQETDKIHTQQHQAARLGVRAA